MEQIKSKWVNGFIIGTFVSLYLLVSIISTIHVIDFFELSNPKWLAISLAIGFELGAAASLAAIITLDKMNKTLVWALFLVITAMQMQGNMYYAFINMGDFTTWSELFNLIEEEPLYQKRVLSFVSGAILPLVALGFIKSLVDYIKPADDSPVLDDSPVEKKTEIDSSLRSEDILDKPHTIHPHTEGMSADDIKAWQEVGDKLAEEVEDEWDEDHALDMVMNDMVKDFTEEDLKEIEVNEPEEVIEEPIQPTPNKPSNRYEQRNDYLSKSTDWDSKEKEYGMTYPNLVTEEGLLPDTVESVELDLQTGQITTPTPIKKIDVEIDEDQFTPKNNFEVDVEVKPSPTPTPTNRPNPNFIVGETVNEVQDQIDSEKKN